MLVADENRLGEGGWVGVQWRHEPRQNVSVEKEEERRGEEKET